MRIALQPTARRPMFPAMRSSRPKPVSAPTSGWVTNANLSKLGGGSRFTTLNAKSNKPLIPKPPSNIDADKQKAAI